MITAPQMQFSGDGAHAGISKIGHQSRKSARFQARPNIDEDENLVARFEDGLVECRRLAAMLRQSPGPQPGMSNSLQNYVGLIGGTIRDDQHLDQRLGIIERQKMFNLLLEQRPAVVDRHDETDRRLGLLPVPGTRSPAADQPNNDGIADIYIRYQRGTGPKHHRHRSPRCSRSKKVLSAIL